MGKQAHPWRELRERPDIELVWTDLGDSIKGLTDGRAIVLAVGLLAVERRCSLMHELVHIEIGVHSCEDPIEEEQACRLTARRLIAIQDLCKEARWTCDLKELADALWVIPDVLEHRLKHLHPAERAMLLQATRHHRDNG